MKTNNHKEYNPRKGDTESINFYNFIQAFILNQDYVWVLDFLEFLLKKLNKDYANCRKPEPPYDEPTEICENFKRDGTVERTNNTFKENSIGYRVFNNLTINSIIDENQIQSIENTLKIDDISTHISKALRHLKKQDFENSIKESITDVELCCSKIVNESISGLKDFFAKLKKKKRNLEIHPALEDGYVSLYGWTSDANGIRHAGSLKNRKSATYEEALYMIVSCSAFINYLQQLNNKE
ncbi:hypothetical protein H9M94_02575 [Mycoplasma sp. Pen4]|uniref:AbiJ-NTD4 domain-containing protein n=1 Tax=Mycoplasma sp. Pen4 TaxID=640330 RepID=UPI0016543987|nr:hypothetical protein [Mycoplasma sp. Pen4]QNM93472.1 hypothetical protein H9M94_02575 [Mycoplasma sp. Pen4]